MGGAAHAEEVERWHARRLARLTAPDGWLSLTGLYWLDDGEHTIGTDPSSVVVLPGGPERLGTLHVRDGWVTVRLDPEAGAVLGDGSAPAGEVTLADDHEPGGPTTIRLGPVSFHVIEREGRLGVRVKDAENPARAEFEGIERFPVDPAWRVEAAFHPHDPGATVLAPDVLGRGQTYRNPGSLAFAAAGRDLCLEAFQEADEDDLFIVFGDATNGTDTFGGGRYLYADPPGPDGTVVLDFNRAYNPPCVFTPHATCVLPVPENRLPIRVEAGERRYGEH